VSGKGDEYADESKDEKEGNGCLCQKNWRCWMRWTEKWSLLMVWYLY